MRAARSSASPAWATGTTTSASPPPSSPQGALGTTTLLRQNYVRVRRVCAAAGCRTTRTPAGTRVVERDLALLPDVPWAQGPAHPTGDEYDLETVVLHELGHWAGNLRHTPVGCHDTPMVKGLGPGEWWRSPSDWHYDACGSAAPARRVRSTSRRCTGRCSTERSSRRPRRAVRLASTRAASVETRDAVDRVAGDPIPGGPTDPDAGRTERNATER